MGGADELADTLLGLRCVCSDQTGSSLVRGGAYMKLHYQPATLIPKSNTPLRPPPGGNSPFEGKNLKANEFALRIKGDVTVYRQRGSHVLNPEPRTLNPNLPHHSLDCRQDILINQRL